MSTKTTVLVSVVLILIVILAGVVLWSRLPETMASHWNEADQVDGTMGKFWGTFMVPAMMIGLTLLFLAIPAIDPLKKNIAEFRGWFNIIIVLFNLFMAFVHGLTLAWNLGFTGFRMSSAMLPAVGLLFIALGLMMRTAKRNYFIGIRTPWTLANDVVWEKTHRLGSKLFITAGILTVLALFFPDKAIVILMASVIGAALIAIVYSYLVFRQEEKKHA
jgi:uncharacterized membrane protein